MGVAADTSDSSTGTAITTTSSTSASTTRPADDTRGATGVTSVDPRGDLEQGPIECSIFTQDCPAGDKCMPWADDGGSTWNATRCSPIADDPAAPGETCHVERSGVDDCELGAMCWDVDPKTNEGTCVSLCVGSERDPLCEDPDEICTVSGDGVLAVCLPTCDPLLQDCPEGQGCYPIGPGWSCAPNAPEVGDYGCPCEFINVCNPGLVCLDAAAVPSGLPCEGATGCCTELCDLSDPTGDEQCAGVLGGQVCQPWYEQGAALPGDEDVGVCAVP
jgi:hypothetical protein